MVSSTGAGNFVSFVHWCTSDMLQTISIWWVLNGMYTIWKALSPSVPLDWWGFSNPMARGAQGEKERRRGGRSPSLSVDFKSRFCHSPWVIRLTKGERIYKPWTSDISFNLGRSLCKKPNLDTGWLPSSQRPLPLSTWSQGAPCCCVHRSPGTCLINGFVPKFTNQSIPGKPA